MNEDGFLQRLSLLAEAGWTADDIARQLCCSPATVRRHARNLGLRLSRESSRGAAQLRRRLQEAFPGYLLLEEHHIGGRLRLDFYLPELGLAFECDGPQHREFIPHFHGSYHKFQEAKLRDRHKDELCARQGVRLVRVSPSALPSTEELQALAMEQPEQPATSEKGKADRERDRRERRRAWRRAQYLKWKEYRRDGRPRPSSAAGQGAGRQA